MSTVARMMKILGTFLLGRGGEGVQMFLKNEMVYLDDAQSDESEPFRAMALCISNLITGCKE